MNLENEFNKLQEIQNKILCRIESLDNSASEKPDVYSLGELAKIFKVTKRTLYNWKDRGLLPVTVIGSKTYVTSSQLKDFLTNHEVKPLNRKG